MCEQSTVAIVKYEALYEEQLFDLIKGEGGEWLYWQDDYRAKYKEAIVNSIVYLLFEKECLCGYIRCRDDNGFGIYIYDLLVDRKYRGNEYGRLLMEQICLDFPNNSVYVLGDVYPYYEDKLGYEIEGKVYMVKQKNYGENK